MQVCSITALVKPIFVAVTYEMSLKMKFLVSSVPLKRRGVSNRLLHLSFSFDAFFPIKTVIYYSYFFNLQFLTSEMGEDNSVVSS